MDASAEHPSLDLRFILQMVLPINVGAADGGQEVHGGCQPPYDHKRSWPRFFAVVVSAMCNDHVAPFPGVSLSVAVELDGIIQLGNAEERRGRNGHCK